jgi:hypothetical protein
MITHTAIPSETEAALAVASLSPVPTAGLPIENKPGKISHLQI